MDCGSFNKEIIDYTSFNRAKAYRYMISCEENKTGQTGIEYQDNFIYRAFLTNDQESSDQDVIDYYYN